MPLKPHPLISRHPFAKFAVANPVGPAPPAPGLGCWYDGGKELGESSGSSAAWRLGGNSPGGAGVVLGLLLLRPWEQGYGADGKVFRAKAAEVLPLSKWL